MTINEVKKKTGLTKKAINYYELKGLINPKYNPINKYRDFSEHDVKKLSITAFLRQLNISIEKIKQILENKISINELLEQHLTTLDNNLESLKCEGDLIRSCMRDYSFEDLDEISTAEILDLKNEIELNQFKRANFIHSQWQRIFPGKLGKLFAFMYNAYLTEPIDSQKKKKAWRDFIDKLDTVEEIEVPPEIAEIINSNFFERLLQASEENFKSSTERVGSLKEKEIPFPPSMPEMSHEVIEVMKMIAKLKKFVVEELQIHLTPMTKHLEILSPSYTKTKEKLAYMSELMTTCDAHKPLLEKYAQIKEKVK